MPCWGAPHSAVVRPGLFGVLLLWGKHGLEAISRRALARGPRQHGGPGAETRVGVELTPERVALVFEDRVTGPTRVWDRARLTSRGGGWSSASVWRSSSSSDGSGLAGGGCCHTMASWACSLRYRLVRWIRLTRLTTFLGAQREGVGRHRLPCGLCPGWHPGLPADLSEDKALGPAHGVGPRGPGGWGRHSPTAAGAGGAAAQQGALAALGTQEGIVLVLQLQQLGAHLLVPAHICGGAGGSWAPPRAPYTARTQPPAHREASHPSRTCRSGQPHVPRAAPPGAPVGQSDGAAEACRTCGLISPAIHGHSPGPSRPPRAAAPSHRGPWHSGWPGAPAAGRPPR